MKRFPNTTWRLRYLWVGPMDNERRAWRICLGTADSIQFLQFLRKAQQNYREILAEELDHSGLAQVEGQPPPPAPRSPLESPEVPDFLRPMDEGEVGYV